MTRRFLVAIVAIVCALPAWFPAPVSAGLAAWGLRAGWSAAQLGGDGGSAIAPDSRSDFTMSVLGTVPIRPGLSFQPEIGWSSKGGQDDFTTGASSFHVEHRLDYIEVPLLLRFDLPVLGKIQPYALGGAAPAWLVGEDDSEISNTESAMTIANQPARPASASANIFEELGTAGSPLPARTFDLGLVGGLGFWIGSGRVRFGFEGRYTYGPLDMVPGGEFEFHNHAFALTTGIEVR